MLSPKQLRPAKSWGKLLSTVLDNLAQAPLASEQRFRASANSLKWPDHSLKWPDHFNTRVKMKNYEKCILIRAQKWVFHFNVFAEMVPASPELGQVIKYSTVLYIPFRAR